MEFQIMLVMFSYANPWIIVMINPAICRYQAEIKKDG